MKMGKIIFMVAGMLATLWSGGAHATEAQDYVAGIENDLFQYCST